MVRGTASSVDTSRSVASAGNPWNEGSRPVLWPHQRRARPGLVLVHRLVQRLGQVAAPGSTWLVVARNTALANAKRLHDPEGFRIVKPASTRAYEWLDPKLV